jgi:hypothetical protein
MDTLIYSAGVTAFLSSLYVGVNIANIVIQYQLSKTKMHPVITFMFIVSSVYVSMVVGFLFTILFPAFITAVIASDTQVSLRLCEICVQVTNKKSEVSSSESSNDKTEEQSEEQSEEKSEENKTILGDSDCSKSNENSSTDENEVSKVIEQPTCSINKCDTCSCEEIGENKPVDNSTLNTENVSHDKSE